MSAEHEAQRLEREAREHENLALQHNVEARRLHVMAKMMRQRAALAAIGLQVEGDGQEGDG